MTKHGTGSAPSPPPARTRMHLRVAGCRGRGELAERQGGRGHPRAQGRHLDQLHRRHDVRVDGPRRLLLRRRRPGAPKLLGALPMYIWENEDVDVDPVRKRLFISRDPRGFTSPASPGDVFPYGAVHIIDVSDPANMKQLNVFLVPAGHTTTCVNRCDIDLDRRARTPTRSSNPGLDGPADLRDRRDRPGEPEAVPGPDRHRPQRRRDRLRPRRPGRRGRASPGSPARAACAATGPSGEHRNPLTGKAETATGCKPIPYAGGGTPETATPSRFMHNSWRDWQARRPDEAEATGLRATTCCSPPRRTSSPTARPRGASSTYDLRGTYNGEGFARTRRKTSTA